MPPARDVESAAIEALRVAQRSYDEAVDALRLARLQAKASATDEGTEKSIRDAEHIVKERRHDFETAAMILQNAASSLLHAKAAFDAAEVALRVARAAHRDPAARAAALVAVQEAEAAGERGRSALASAGRRLVQAGGDA